MRRYGKGKGVSDTRDQSHKNNVNAALDYAHKLEQEYDNMVVNKIGYDNRLAEKKLDEAIQCLINVSSEAGLQSHNANSNSDFAKICTRRAELYMKKGLYNSAQGDLDSANNVRPTAENYKNKAKCNEKLDQINDALTNYQLALSKAEEEKTNENKREKNSLIAGILLERGKLYVSQRRPHEAIVDFNKAIALTGTSESKSDSMVTADLYLERGKCFRELMEYKKSIDDLEIAINRLQKPSVSKRVQAQAFNELGFSYYENGQFEKVDKLSRRQWNNIIKL